VVLTWLPAASEHRFTKCQYKVQVLATSTPVTTPCGQDSDEWAAISEPHAGIVPSHIVCGLTSASWVKFRVACRPVDRTERTADAESAAEGDGDVIAAEGGVTTTGTESGGRRSCGAVVTDSSLERGGAIGSCGGISADIKSADIKSADGANAVDEWSGYSEPSGWFQVGFADFGCGAPRGGVPPPTDHFSEEELAYYATLDTPAKIQDYLDTIPMNHEVEVRVP
jgi:hypothetical protein